MTSPRIELFGRAGCHLCDEARVIVESVAAESDVGWVETDVDVVGGDTLEEYGELVPVVEVDGVRQGYWRIDAHRLRQALASAPREP
jgi:hypothetical protein